MRRLGQALKEQPFHGHHGLAAASRACLDPGEQGCFGRQAYVAAIGIAAAIAADVPACRIKLERDRLALRMWPDGATVVLQAHQCPAAAAQRWAVGPKAIGQLVRLRCATHQQQAQQAGGHQLDRGALAWLLVELLLVLGLMLVMACHGIDHRSLPLACHAWVDPAIPRAYGDRFCMLC